MIRVVYRFKVRAAQEEPFINAWARVTGKITETAKGAYGSQLFQSHDDRSEFIAVARWESIEDWRAFQKGERPDPEGGRKMRAAAELISTEVFDEVEDLLKYQAVENNPVQNLNMKNDA
jgi:heme-degrading monooxygenase HmoA